MGLLKVGFEFFPLGIFFAFYKLFGLPVATAALICATLISICAIYLIEKKLSMSLIVSASLVVIFGGISILSNDSTFIKIKPTILNLSFAVILLIGFARKKGLLKYLMGSALVMSDESWLKLSFRWACFFIALALINEIVWRNFPEEVWVNFKVFGMLPLTLLFVLSQTPFIMKNVEKDK